MIGGKGSIMVEYSYILFDLDGTLTDPGEGIRNSVAYAINKMGLPEQTKEERNRFIGPPLQEGFRCWCGLNEEMVNRAVAYYREYYQQKGMLENILYQGVEHMLRILKEQGRELIVATSKPEIYAKQILDYFHISSFFSCIAGGSLDGSRCTKSEVIRYALKKCQIRERSCAVMVGDRKHDILGARSEGLDSIGVLYGYGTEEELIQAGATMLAKDREEIVRICLGEEKQIR